MQRDEDAACRIIEGTARSMGIEVVINLIMMTQEAKRYKNTFRESLN